MAIKGKKAKNPPFFSQEFFIQNHADIVAVIATIIIAGLMVEIVQPVASSFISPQHNVTLDAAEANAPTFYRAGQKDMLNVFFYTLIMILAHAVIQEFVLDKFNKKLHLSKIKFSKFNESGQLVAFYVFAFSYAVNLLFDYIVAEGHYTQFISSLWNGYPEQHSLMPWHMKLFFILNIAYWIHVYPELYLQKTKKEEMSARVQYATLYLVAILVGYVLSYHRIMLILLAMHYLVEGIFHLARILYFLDKEQPASIAFGIWAASFVIVRLGTVALSVLVFWFGFGRVHAENPSMFTSVPFRVGTLAVICSLQAWLAWNFITFQMKRAKDSKMTAKKQQQKSVNGSTSSKKKN